MRPADAANLLPHSADPTSTGPLRPAEPPNGPRTCDLFGAPLPTSVHTYETSRRPPGTGRPPDDLDGRYSPGLAAAVRQARRAEERLANRTMPTPPALEIPSPGERSRRHAWWQDERHQVRAAMLRAGFPAARIERFDCCGSAAFVLVERGKGNVRRACNKCRDRHCKPCQIERANLYAGNLRKKLAEGYESYCRACKRAGRTPAPLDRRFRFVTLTLRSNTDPLAKQMRSFSAAFTRLRKMRLCDLRSRRPFTWWQRYVRGGCYFLEATINPDSGLWHVHAHLIVEGSYLPQDELASLWAVATGGSSIVDVRALSGIEDAAAEVSKYTAKGADAKLLAAGDALVEWMIGTKSLRLCSTFGTWRGFRLAAKSEEYDPAAWVNVGREDDIRRRAALGDIWARTIVAQLDRDTAGRSRPRPPPGPALPDAMEGVN